MKKMVGILVCFVFICIGYGSFAVAKANLITNKQEFSQGEIIEVNLQISDMSVAAMQVELLFEQEKLEFISGPETSNYKDNRILFAWFDEQGGQKPKQSGEIVATFTFKTKQEGDTNIQMYGEFYDEKARSINTISEGTTIHIKKKQTQVQDENNANLEVLRLNHEGISPYFEKDVTNYYFIADETIDSLEVTALPEEENAKVTITGNTNLKLGLNTILIEVQSPNRKNTKKYEITVTKTKNEKAANTNLETLAVENVLLYPSFDTNITNYEVIVDNKTESLNVLAIPESMKASVTIQGKDNLQIGDNLITIIVIAEDGTTEKKYFIRAHRRDAEEQKEEEKQEKIEAEILSALLENEIKEENIKQAELVEQEEKSKILVYGILGGFIIVIVIIIIEKKKKNKE